MSFFNMKREYLLLAPIVFLLFNACYFRYASKEIDDALLRQKALEAENHVEMLAVAAEADQGRQWSEHEKNICASVEFLDNLPMMYAAVYKPVNGELLRLSERNFETSFDPVMFPEFQTAIQSVDKGNLTVSFESEGYGYREIHLYFRWTPSYSQPQLKYLIVAAVSKYTVVTEISKWVSVGQWVSMAVTFVLNMLLVIMICRLGYNHSHRGRYY